MFFPVAAVVAPTLDPAPATSAQVNVGVILDGDVPEDVWQSAIAHGATAKPDDLCECLYVPVGSEFTSANGTVWTVTVDGAEPVSNN